MNDFWKYGLLGKQFKSFLHPEDAYKGAQDKAQEGFNQAQSYQTPYWQHGNDQYDALNQGRQDLMDPQKLQDKWSSGYETSPYAQRMLQMNQQQGNEAASSMGLGSSSAALGNIQQGAGDIVSKDRQQYMDDLMKKYMSGIGVGQNLYGVGAQAGSQLGSQAFQQGNNMAGLEYGRQAAPGQLFGQIAGTALNMYAPGMGFGNAFTGANGGASTINGANKYNQ